MPGETKISRGGELEDDQEVREVVDIATKQLDAWLIKSEGVLDFDDDDAEEAVQELVEYSLGGDIIGKVDQEKWGGRLRGELLEKIEAKIRETFEKRGLKEMEIVEGETGFDARIHKIDGNVFDPTGKILGKIVKVHQRGLEVERSGKICKKPLVIVANDDPLKPTLEKFMEEVEQESLKWHPKQTKEEVKIREEREEDVAEADTHGEEEMAEETTDREEEEKEELGEDDQKEREEIKKLFAHKQFSTLEARFRENPEDEVARKDLVEGLVWTIDNEKWGGRLRGELLEETEAKIRDILEKGGLKETEIVEGETGFDARVHKLEGNVFDPTEKTLGKIVGIHRRGTEEARSGRVHVKPQVLVGYDDPALPTLEEFMDNLRKKSLERHPKQTKEEVKIGKEREEDVAEADTHGEEEVAEETTDREEEERAGPEKEETGSDGREREKIEGYFDDEKYTGLEEKLRENPDDKDARGDLVDGLVWEIDRDKYAGRLKGELLQETEARLSRLVNLAGLQEVEVDLGETDYDAGVHHINGEIPVSEDMVGKILIAQARGFRDKDGSVFREPIVTVGRSCKSSETPREDEFLSSRERGGISEEEAKEETISWSEEEKGKLREIISKLEVFERNTRASVLFTTDKYTFLDEEKEAVVVNLKKAHARSMYDKAGLPLEKKEKAIEEMATGNFEI
ncbi:hypothetical protein HQ544_03590 [Candidatus Falkowbacteria bacterium]|nr:hypothetical protein [Candidatus Falkowbacteria bacterium]